MARYIDAEKIEIRVSCGINNDGLIFIPMKDVHASIDRTPTADVVEVVRCKDCVSSRPLRRNDRFEALFAEGCVYCMRSDDGVDNEHFCGYGERKEA